MPYEYKFSVFNKHPGENETELLFLEEWLNDNAKEGFKVKEFKTNITGVAVLMEKDNPPHTGEKEIK